MSSNRGTSFLDIAGVIFLLEADLDPEAVSEAGKLEAALQALREATSAALRSPCSLLQYAIAYLQSGVAAASVVQSLLF